MSSVRAERKPTLAKSRVWKVRKYKLEQCWQARDTQVLKSRSCSLG
jgi:hypothetical protein